MKNYDLIQEMLKRPMDMEVYVPSRTGDYENGLVKSVYCAEMELQNGDIVEAILIDEE
jgi:hypothetical protein